MFLFSGAISIFYHTVKHERKINTSNKRLHKIVSLPLPTEDVEVMTCKLMYYHNICLEGLKKTMKTLSKIATSQPTYQLKALSLHHPVTQRRLMGG
jgi:hypothetical protein